MSKPKCTVYRQYCATHDFVHGAEAEELRSGIEEMIKEFDQQDNVTDDDERLARKLQRLLDRIDARDSLAWLETEDNTRKGKKKVKVA